tara:strand:- start:358 stop:714 length:357 start_codon:yes stop_codon:yes gene_type:complete
VRDLTKEGEELAPEWATHYIIDEDDDVVYESQELFWWSELGEPQRNFNFDVDRNRPIHKTLDLTKHEFSDVAIRVSNLCKSKIEFAVDDCGIEHYFTQSKVDVIEIAKALGVTGEDLK